jgi:hypothetical protein
MVCESPAAIAVTVPSELGTVHWPKKFEPQHATAPFCFSATVCESPAAIAVTVPSELGTVH